MSAKAMRLAARYGRRTDLIEAAREIVCGQYHVSAFNFPECPAVTASEEIQVFRWGLIPYWTKSQEDSATIRKMTLNAKSETLFEKPSFRQPVLKKRCLIPSTGYFDWRHEGDRKIPYFIRLKEEEIFSMAGIYDLWTDNSTGDQLATFSIITTGTNPLTDYIHNTKHRMPAILPPGDEERWLDPRLEKEEIASLLQPFDAARMEAYRIGNDFLKKKPDDASIIRQIG